MTTISEEAQYRAIFEAANDALTITNPDGIIVEANPAACRMYGYSYEELIGLHGMAVTHPDYHHLARTFPDTVKAGGSIELRAVNLRKDGTPFYIEERATGLLYKGRPHILSVIRDITAQVRAEEQLREKEEQYRSIFEASNDALIITDLDGFCVEANAAACHMYGYSYEEMIGLHAATVTHPDYHDVMRTFPETIKAGGSIEARSINLRKDGTPFYVEGRGTGFLYRGKPHILAVNRDISERVQAYELLEQRVEERTRELSTLLDISHNVASTLELQPLLDLILNQLKAVVEYVGAVILMLQGEELVVLARQAPGPDTQAGPDRYPMGLVRPILDAIRPGEPLIIADVRAETPLARAYRASVGEYLDTAFSYERCWMAVPMMVKDRMMGVLGLSAGKPGYYMPRDAPVLLAIANQAAVAIENARLYEQAQHVAAMEERQRLARELHDSVSQALYGIGLGARTARTLLDRDPAQVAEPLDYVLALAEAGLAEMRALIFELLPEALEEDGLVAALDKQAAALRARYNITIATILDAEPEAPLAVKEALYRIAQEALHNAVKHAQARTIEVRLEVQPEALVLEVRDDGVGFETGGTFPGHLGLRTMRERATHLGGMFTLESAPRAGTRIRARIPYRGA